MKFIVTAVRDGEARVFRSESDIVGLHIEAETLTDFREVMADIALELILANHVTNEDLLTKSLKELVPVIWTGTDGEQLLRGHVVDAVREQGFGRVRQGKGDSQIWGQAAGTNNISVPTLHSGGNNNGAG